MAVNIDPSEVRTGPSITAPAAKSRLRLPKRAILAGGLGGAGLIAFSVGAFSFFSTLADPRARSPRPMPAAASMPDLKDGMPALVNGEPSAPSPQAAFNLPRPAAEPQPLPTEQVAGAQPASEPAPVARTAAIEPQPPAPRAAPIPPPIQNAATLPETHTVSIVAPPTRPVATIAPARSETVKAKSAAAIAAVRDPEPEPTSTATAVAPQAQAAHKTAAAKPPLQKTAARKTPATTKTVANAEPGPTAAPDPSSAASDDSELPGARQFRAGIKAIGGIFGGDKDE